MCEASAVAIGDRKVSWLTDPCSSPVEHFRSSCVTDASQPHPATRDARTRPPADLPIRDRARNRAGKRQTPIREREGSSDCPTASAVCDWTRCSSLARRGSAYRGPPTIPATCLFSACVWVSKGSSRSAAPAAIGPASGRLIGSRRRHPPGENATPRLGLVVLASVVWRVFAGGWLPSAPPQHHG
jgi:hypothetical protein